MYFLEDFLAVAHALGSAAHPRSIAFTSSIKLYFYCPNFIWDIFAVAYLAVANSAEFMSAA